MKSTVKFVLAALALSALAFFSTASAQQGQGRGKGGGMTIEAIEQAVGTLKADVKTKIEAILAKSREDMQAIPKEDRKEKGPAVSQKARKDILALLTPEQAKAFEEKIPQGGRGGGKKNQ
jgi:Spy/CpxP family protein refolding chaperone